VVIRKVWQAWVVVLVSPYAHYKTWETLLELDHFKARRTEITGPWAVVLNLAFVGLFMFFLLESVLLLLDRKRPDWQDGE
jgi:hypothetical protein